MNRDFDIDRFRLAPDALRRPSLQWVACPESEQGIVRARASHQRAAAPGADPRLVARERGGDLVSLEGELGEWIVAHTLALPLHPLNVHGGDPGYDFVLPDGVTLGVKSTRHQGGVLLYQQPDAFLTDIAALVYVNARRMSGAIAGWITRERFMKHCEKFSAGRLGTEVCARPGLLSPIGLLGHWIEDRRTR